MHTHSVQQGADKAFTLQRDSNPCQCPKVLFSQPQQGAMGQMVVIPIKMTCSTNCPFAQVIEKEENKAIYVITCEGQKQEFILSEIKYQDPKNPSKLVSLNNPQAQ